MKLSKHEKKELKELFHNVIMERDGHKCLKCDNEETLCASHIYPKGTYRKMEWDDENAVAFCVHCHIYWWHKNPIEAWEWLEKNIAPERLARLKLMTQTINKKPLDYKLIKVYLEQKLKEYQNESNTVRSK
jgi:5-methylcytosine-specific restriction endonuclease McrA